jgi:hypothetical protein
MPPHKRMIMKYLLPLLFLSIASSGLKAQCSAYIPADAMVLQAMDNAAITDNNGVFWVCAGTHLLVEGNNNVVFAESFTSGTITGNNNIIYSKGGSFFLAGNNNTLTTTEPATVSELGENNEVVLCDVVNFDDSTAPPGGCQITTDLATMDAGALKVFPNPFTNALMIQHPSGERLEEVRIFDARGILVFERAGSSTGALDLGHLASGPFILQVRMGESEVVNMIHKE